MAKYLDVASWPRHRLFEFFRGYDQPYFNVCTRLDVTKLLTLLGRPGVGVSLAYHYFALRVANEVAPFRYRLRGGRVLIHGAVHGGTTVLLPDESFAFAYFSYEEDVGEFIGAAQEAVDAVRAGGDVFRPQSGDDMVHFTTLPCVSFTSFAHARISIRPA